MAYVVDRVVICDAFREPDQHYQLLPGGKSKLVAGRRPSMRFLASAKDVKGGIAGIVGKEAGLFEDMLGLERGAERVRQPAPRRSARLARGRLPGHGAGYAAAARMVVRARRGAQGDRPALLLLPAGGDRDRHLPVRGAEATEDAGDGRPLRYALKLATGTGKTVVMALLVTWSTLHKRKVSGSSLSANFLVLVPNLTVRDRVSGVPRGDGLDPSRRAQPLRRLRHGAARVPRGVPPEHAGPQLAGHPARGQARRLDRRGESIEEGRFIPAAVLRAMRRRAQQDPNAPIRRMLGGWRDLVVINDEAHHVYGEKRDTQGRGAGVHQVEQDPRADLEGRDASAWSSTSRPRLGTAPGRPSPRGRSSSGWSRTSPVYDAFESGLVKVVRLPDPDEQGRIYLDLWDLVKGAKTKEEYIRACKGAIASIYSSWKKDFDEWGSTFELCAGPSPVLLVRGRQRDNAPAWLFEHLTHEYELLRNPDDEDRTRWVTIQIDSKVFDADKGNEAVLREMVNTVGKKGKPGEHVRCIVSVNMLSEGWDVKSVTHILGLRAFGSPLLTEQIIGRGLRRTNYDVLNQPLEERPEGSEETVDAFGIPFVGFPVEKRKRPEDRRVGPEAGLDRARCEEGEVPRPRAERARPGPWA